MTVARNQKAPRPKPKDFRVKLTAENHETLITHLSAKGFSGPHAKQDWLRSLIPAMQPVSDGGIAQPAQPHRRRPLPGAQDALADLGSVGTDLRRLRHDVEKMATWMDRIDPVFIADEHKSRVRNELPELLARLLARLDEAEKKITPKLDTAIDAVTNAMRR